MNESPYNTIICMKMDSLFCDGGTWKALRNTKADTFYQEENHFNLTLLQYSTCYFVLLKLLCHDVQNIFAYVLQLLFLLSIVQYFIKQTNHLLFIICIFLYKFALRLFRLVSWHDFAVFCNRFFWFHSFIHNDKLGYEMRLVIFAITKFYQLYLRIKVF